MKNVIFLGQSQPLRGGGGGTCPQAPPPLSPALKNSAAVHYGHKVYLRRERGPSVDVAAGWFVSWLVICETLDTEAVIAVRKKGHPRYK